MTCFFCLYIFFLCWFVLGKYKLESMSVCLCRNFLFIEKCPRICWNSSTLKLVQDLNFNFKIKDIIDIIHSCFRKTTFHEVSLDLQISWHPILFSCDIGPNSIKNLKSFIVTTDTVAPNWAQITNWKSSCETNAENISDCVLVCRPFLHKSASIWWSRSNSSGPRRNPEKEKVTKHDGTKCLKSWRGIPQVKV